MIDLRKMIVPLNIEISDTDQNEIIESALKNGIIAEVEGNVIPPFWIGEGLRNIDASSWQGVPKNEIGRLTYLVRLHHDLQWEWSKQAVVSIIQKVLAPLEKSIKKLNRVATIIQIPGKEVPGHRDLIVGDTYSDMMSETSTFYGDSTLKYMGDPWFKAILGNIPTDELHKKQKNFGLRIPVSCKPRNNGKAYIENKNSEKMYYSTNNNLFLLNESLMNHGADAVDFYRGVVIVDAELDLNEMERFFLT